MSPQLVVILSECGQNDYWISQHAGSATKLVAMPGMPGLASANVLLAT